MSLHQPPYIIEDVNIKPLPNSTSARAAIEVSLGLVHIRSRAENSCQYVELNITSINIGLMFNTFPLYVYMT